MASHPIVLPPRLRDRALFHSGLHAAFGNPAFDAASLRVLILRLSPWRDVASSSPHLFLAQQARRALPDAFLDFAFLPQPEDARMLRAAKRPLAVGVQSRRGLAAFDLVLVSNSFTLEAVNLPALLLDAGLSPWADERSPAAPPVILGGSNAFASHGLVRPDGVGVPDAIFFGEAEECLVPFLQAWLGAAALDKHARLVQAAAASDGFWVTGAWPDAKAPVRQAVAREVCAPAARGPGRAGATAVARAECGEPRRTARLEPSAETGKGCCYPLLDSEAADTARLPAAYGCPAFCTFCFEGFERKPYREIPAELLLAQARQLKAASGARCVELDAYTLNSHAEAAGLIAGLSRLFERVSLKSQRVDILAAQPALAAVELAAGKRSFTLGIEGISARMRAFLNKTVTDDEIERTLQNLLARGVREIKLFYLITGHEVAEDIVEFGAFTRLLGQRILGSRLPTRVVFSFGFLVRMPNTPLRYDRLFLEREPLERKARELERMCTRSQFEFRLAASWSEYFLSQVLAAGDYRLAPLIVELAREGRYYDGETTAEYAQRLQAGMLAAGLWDEAWLAEKPAAHRFPFAFVATAVSPKFLWKRYEKARACRDAGYCLGDTCRVCGACRDKAERRVLTSRARSPEIPLGAAAGVDTLVRDKQRLPLLYCRVRLGAAFAQASSEYTSALLLQLLLARLPEEVDNLLAVDEALFASPDTRDRFPIPAGETVVALKAWDAPRLAAKLQTCATDPQLEMREVLSSYTPGRFTSATWQVSCGAKPAVLEAAVVAWLKDVHLPFTLRRMGAGVALELAPAALRKGFVLAAGCRADGAGSLAELTITPKADLFALLRKLPADASASVVCTSVDFGASR
ncbi:MAG: radical SAM protein [Kiritimatiellia bacterium]